MSPDEEEMADFMRLTAADIDHQSDIKTQSRYEKFVQACEARSERQVLDQQADMDAYSEAREKDLADYERAKRAEASGELHTAAEWYRKAADNDFADSALRLAEVLERIAKRHLAMPSSRAAASELYLSIEEASKSYIAALVAGDISFDEWEIRHEQLLNHLYPSRVPNRPTVASAEKPRKNSPKSQAKSLSLVSVDDKPDLQKTGRLNTQAPDHKSGR
jgi:hypothetical protein